MVNRKPLKKVKDENRTKINLEVCNLLNFLSDKGLLYIDFVHDPLANRIMDILEDRITNKEEENHV